MGNWAKNLNLTVGQDRTDVWGVLMEMTLGNDVNLIINPLGLLGLYGGGALPTNSLGALMGTMAMAGAGVGQGYVEIVFGSVTEMFYGPKYGIHRGCEWTAHGDISGPNGPTLLIGTAASLYCLVQFGSMFIELMGPSAGSDVFMGIVGVLLPAIILDVWVLLELFNHAKHSVAGFADAVANLTAADAQQNKSQPGVFSRIGKAIGDAFKNQMPNDEEIELPKIWGDDVVFDDLGAGAGCGSGESELFNGRIETVDSDKLVMAPTLTYLANGDTEQGIIASIDVQALGTEGTDGDILIYSTHETHLSGGPMAYIDITTEEAIGEITLDCFADGTITLQSGETKEPNSLIMSPEGIFISSLVEMLLKVEPANLSITPEGITIAVAESVIEITPEGIVLSSGPASIEISAEGVTISGPIVTVEGEGTVEIGAPAVMISE